MVRYAKPNTGRIVWSFDDPTKRATDFFLVMARSGTDEIRIGGFQATGKNTSADPVSQFKGNVRSDRTNKSEIIYLTAEEEDSAKRGLFEAPIPTLPEETFGIPALAEFKITSFERVFFETGKSGVPATQFLKDFGPFTVILEYDGIKVERRFSKEQLEQEIARFESFSNPNSNVNPKILRRPNAAPPKFPTDFPPLLTNQDHPKG